MSYASFLSIISLNVILGLLALFLLRKNASYFLGFQYFYQILFSLLASLICPTFLLAGHGAIPLPTLTAIAMLILGNGSEYQFTFSDLGLKNSTGLVWLMPAAVCFIAVYLSSWSKIKKQCP
jgi:hypothetical protein